MDFHYGTGAIKATAARGGGNLDLEESGGNE